MWAQILRAGVGREGSCTFTTLCIVHLLCGAVGRVKQLVVQGQGVGAEPSAQSAFVHAQSASAHAHPSIVPPGHRRCGLS